MGLERFSASAVVAFVLDVRVAFAGVFSRFGGDFRVDMLSRSFLVGFAFAVNK